VKGQQVVDQQMQVLWHGRRIEAEQDRPTGRVGYRGSIAISHPLHGRERLIARISVGWGQFGRWEVNKYAGEVKSPAVKLLLKKDVWRLSDPITS
jgi:hypothetical protein